MEFEFAPVVNTDPHKNPQGVAISTGQVTVQGDWQYGTYGSLHFQFNSAHYGAYQGARLVTYTLPAPDGAWHKITAEYDLQFVTIKRDDVIVVRDWLDQVTTEIPSRPGLAASFNTPIRNIKATPFDVAPILPEVRWQGVVGNSSVPNHGPTMWATFFPANAMCAWGDYVFVCFGFNEAFPELVRFHKNNPQATDLQFGMRHLATLDEVRVPVDLAIGADNLLYVKRANGLVTKFNPNTGQALSPLTGSAIDFPAVAPRPMPLPDHTWNVNDKIIGEPGGYANGTDIKLTRFGHWFIDGGRNPRTAACFQNDGKFWLSDTATCRLIRFNADGTPDGSVIHWTPHSYVCAVDKNNRRRVFNRFIEYLDGQPVRFYGNDPDVVFNFGEGFSSVATINGETLATMIAYDSLGRRQIVKLTDAGIVPTGQLVQNSGLLEKNGSIVNNTRTVDGVSYNFQSGGVTGYHLTATRNGATLWQAMPTGDNTGNGTFDLRCESGMQSAAPGCIAVAGPYVITACKMEFWKNGHTGQGNQLFIHDKATGKFLRQFGLPLMHRGEIDHAPGAPSNIFSLDAWENPDGTISVISNDEWGKGVQVWKVFPSAPPSGGLATVIVQATDASASETAADQGTFTVSRTGDTSAPLTINYTISGSAQNGTDYDAIGNSITIPAGASTADIAIVPKADDLVEGLETIILTLADSSSYNVGTSASATVNLSDAIPSAANQPDLIVTSLSVTPATPLAGQPVSFTATIKNQGSVAVPVGTSIGLGFFVDFGSAFGTPGNPVAWTALSGGLAPGASATLTASGGPEAGRWIATIGTHQIAVFADDLNNIAESNDSNNTATLSITTILAPPSSIPTVTVTATDAQATEPANAPAPNAAPDTGSFVITRTGDLSTALTVTYTISGSANNGVDYNPLGNTVTIPAGSASATITVTPINDTVVEPTKTVTLLVLSTANYNVGAAANATVTIIDNDGTPPPPTDQPDLIVTSFTISPAAPLAGKPVTFTATVKNQGSAAIPAGTSIGLGFFVDVGLAFGTPGNPVAWTSLPGGLAPGASATIVADGGPEKGSWTTTSGTHQIAAFVDDLNKISEANDGNNLLLRTLTVAAAPPAVITNPPVIITPPPPGIADLAITNLTASLLYPVEGSPLIFRAWVRNQGTASTPATNLHVLFYLDDTEAVTWSGIVAPLRPGETRIITASGGLNQTNRSNRSAWIAQPGAHKITAAIDIANHIVESNETNNTCSLNLLIPHLTAPLVSATSPRYSTTSEGTNGVRLFTFTRRGATNDDLLVRFAVGGTARSGDDFEPLAGEVIIPAGATQATVQYTPVDDDTVEPMETLTLTLLPSLDYKVNRNFVARLLIYDNDRDSDRDGVTDRLEILAGTNPRDPLSH